MNFDLSQIQTALLSEIKFKADNYTSTLDASLIGVSNSGRYYNIGVNPLITLRNVLSFMLPASSWVVPTYSGTDTYLKDDLVVSASIYYVSLQDNNIGHAVNLTTWWKVTTLESVWIKNKLLGVFESVLSKSILTSPILDHAKLYSISDDSDLIVNASNYVGFEIRPKSSDHLKITINRISGQFSEDENVTMYLYKNNTLVTSFAITGSADFAFTDITDIDLTGEARWFLFYDQDDLTGQAYNSVMNDSKLVCIKPFEVPNTTTDFINDVNSYTSNSYGLGIDISVTADLTQFILSNIQVFVECIHLQWQYDILEMFFTNPEVRITLNERNISSDKVSEYIMIDLRGDTKHSLASKLDRAYKKLIDALDFQDPALPGSNDNYVTFNYL
jgi:hypothetical protein